MRLVWARALRVGSEMGKCRTRKRGRSFLLANVIILLKRADVLRKMYHTISKEAELIDV